MPLFSLLLILTNYFPFFCDFDARTIASNFSKLFEWFSAGDKIHCMNWVHNETIRNIINVKNKLILVLIWFSILPSFKKGCRMIVTCDNMQNMAEFTDKQTATWCTLYVLHVMGSAAPLFSLLPKYCRMHWPQVHSCFSWMWGGGYPGFSLFLDDVGCGCEMDSELNSQEGCLPQPKPENDQTHKKKHNRNQGSKTTKAKAYLQHMQCKVHRYILTETRKKNLTFFCQPDVCEAWGWGGEVYNFSVISLDLLRKLSAFVYLLLETLMRFFFIIVTLFIW